MISYLLIALGLGLVIVVAATRTWLSPILVALALVASMTAVEMAQGWPTTSEPPRRGIVWSAFMGSFLVISENEQGASPRLYAHTYNPELEGKLKSEGPMVYDLDAPPPGGEQRSGEKQGLSTLNPNSFTTLESQLGGKE